MSLEQAIQENTLAMRDLIQALHVAADPARIPAQGEKQADAELKKEKKAAKVKEVEPEVVQETAEKESEDKPIEYADVRNVIMSIAKTDRTEAEAVLQRYGVTQISKLKPEQYADVMAFATKVVNGEVSALAGEGDLE